MNCWEAYYTQTFQQQGLLIQEPHTPDLTPLYTLVQDMDPYKANDIHRTGSQTQRNHCSTGCDTENSPKTE